MHNITMNAAKTEWTRRRFLHLGSLVLTAPGAAVEQGCHHPVVMDITGARVSVTVFWKCHDGFCGRLAVVRQPCAAEDSLCAAVNRALVKAEERSAVFIREVRLVAPPRFHAQLIELGAEAGVTFHFVAPLNGGACFQPGS